MQEPLVVVLAEEAKKEAEEAEKGQVVDLQAAEAEKDQVVDLQAAEAAKDKVVVGALVGAPGQIVAPVAAPAQGHQNAAEDLENH